MGGSTPIDIARLADGYDDKRRMDPADFERLLGLIQHHGQVTGRALEVGCGTGFLLIPLAQRLPDVQFCGVEPAQPMLAQARRKATDQGLANCFLARGDGHSLPFADGTFDFTLMSQVLHFFHDRPAAAAEVRRVGTGSARLLVITTSHRQLRAQVDLSFFPGMIKREVARIPSTADIRRTFEDQGFELHNTTEFAATFHASSAEALAERVAEKPWSSYLLFGEREFAARLKGFRRRLKESFGRGEIAYLVPQTLMFFRRA
jgi:ubiquinone/menaquinone biosynthesis C-methylase UbiE